MTFTTALISKTKTFFCKYLKINTVIKYITKRLKYYLPLHDLATIKIRSTFVYLKMALSEIALMLTKVLKMLLLE